MSKPRTLSFGGQIPNLLRKDPFEGCSPQLTLHSVKAYGRRPTLSCSQTSAILLCIPLHWSRERVFVDHPLTWRGVSFHERVSSRTFVHTQQWDVFNWNETLANINSFYCFGLKVCAFDSEGSTQCSTLPGLFHIMIGFTLFACLKITNYCYFFCFFLLMIYFV